MLRELLARWRMKWFYATHTLDYTAHYLEQVYRVYLNHNKVIHFRDGYPVYSLSSPAVFSKPAANFMARALFKTIQNRPLPNLMSFAVNDICNAHCQHCSFFDGVEDRTRPVLTLEQARRLIRDAQGLGVSVINFVGGEPTLREDLPEIIRSVDKDLSTTLLFTNGSVLAEQAGLLRKSGLDSVYVSIDSAEPEEHDRFRGSKGLFERAMRGVKAAKAVGLSTGLSCTLTPEAFRKGELDRLIELGRRIGVHEVLVFDAMPAGRYQWRQDLVDNNEWVDRMIAEAATYNADPSYPGVLVWAYASSHLSAGCSCGTSYLYVSPYGDVMSCDFNHASFGNVLETPLYRIWEHMSAMEEFKQAKWGGCKIKDSLYRARATVSGGRP